MTEEGKALLAAIDTILPTLKTVHGENAEENVLRALRAWVERIEWETGTKLPVE